MPIIRRLPTRALSIIAVLLILAVSSGAAPPKTPVISFSKDERTVSVDYARGKWTFYRPVVSPWDFKPAGKILWVATTGDDAGDGSADRPLRSIGRAMEISAAGDLIYVRPGTYVENITIKKSGEEKKPIVLSCAPGGLGKVKITPPAEYVAKNPSGAVVQVHTARHVWINGLVVEGPKGRPEAPASEAFGANGITFSGGGGPGCRVTNCVVYGNVHCGIKEMAHGGRDIVLESNVIFDNGTRGLDHGIYCPTDGLVIRGNIIFDQPGCGIHSYSHPHGQRISQNLCLGNKMGGILLSGSKNEVRQNVCAYNGLGIVYFRILCTDNIVKNNIFAFNKTDCGFDDGGGKLGDPANNLDDFNCYFPGKPSDRIHPGKHEVLADPLFIDPAHGDFRLQRGSPCAKKGESTDGVPRGDPPDLGAFEPEIRLMPGGRRS